jgi:carboxyl-terminal processing protease
VEGILKVAIAFALAIVPLWPADIVDPGIGLRDRIWIASKIYASIESRFGHWQAIPGFDLDKAYEKYLDEIATTTKRRDFDLATVAFVAQLRNGHTTFSDTWLRARTQLPGFYLGLERGQWVVRRSGRTGLEPGDVVVSIAGQPVGDFVGERTKYISASSEMARRTGVFFFAPIWPAQFEVALADGRRLWIDRTQNLEIPAASPPQWLFGPRGCPPEGIAYLQIASFVDSKQEQDAIGFLKTHRDAPAIVLDVRGNGGGSTPEELIRAIMDRPWPQWIESTSLQFPLFRTYGETFSPKDTAVTPRLKGYLEAFADYFSHPYLMLPAPPNQPDNPVYTGKLIVLADFGCGSACEDFIMPLKFSGRATIVGETTGGSSGQPYVYDFGNGMLFRVSTKRMYFPDGSEFEGIGIKPDVEVIPTAADIKSGRDPALARAVALTRGQ